MLGMGSDEINIKELRMKARLTLGTLADLTGYSVSHIVQLENMGEGSRRMRNDIISVLLQREEEGLEIEIKIWRSRAMEAEDRLALIKQAMKIWLNKI